jgi:hypothetical protein
MEMTRLNYDGTKGTKKVQPEHSGLVGFFQTLWLCFRISQVAGAIVAIR